MSSDIRIRLARPADAPRLVEVEASAGTLFRTISDLAWIADQTLDPPETLLPLIAAGTVWAAEDSAAKVVGQLRGTISGAAFHILELAVAMDFQQRGIGRRLIDAAQALARTRGLTALTLTTFRDVAWNAPFYARYGFAEIAGDARLDAIVRAEEARGLPDRCAMRMALG